MEAKEALIRIKDHFRIHDDGRPTPYLDEAVGIAIDALEKQITKKPKKLEASLGMIIECPNCERLQPVRGLQCVCIGCGQRLDLL